jgi:adenine-specific DNA methylase
VVVDPFGGTGTVAGVARTLGRYGVSNDLSAAYNRLAIWRIWSSGHFGKTEQRKWAGRQGTML